MNLVAMRVVNGTRGFEVAARAGEAAGFWLRLRGLMFRSGLAEGEGLLIRPCQGVHTHFMRFPIDVIFLDRDWRVVHVIPAMAPWRISPHVRESAMVLEVAAGAAGPTAPGDQFEVQS